MTVIKVPIPPESAFNKQRRVSSLLRTQLEHLQEAEFRLPARDQTNVYINAIKTEGEAAEYIGQVTGRLQAAHAMKERPKVKGKTSRVPAIAAMAEKKATRKHKRAAGKSKAKASGRRR